MRAGYQVIENFCPEAEAMRVAFAEHCERPESHTPDKHQVWNYWHVPETYTYLRTNPDKVIGETLINRFYSRLSAEAFERWGLSKAYRPYLSLYVAGCHQALHNDAVGGRLGYVYSLTRWAERSFQGGETLIFREDGYFSTPAMTRPGATQNFYDLIPARFNQLLVFDDRLPHAVPRIEGLMDPMAGRLVLHGHFEEGGIAIDGPLNQAATTAILSDIQTHLRARAADSYHGLLTARLWINRDGSVRDVRPLLDRVLPARLDAPAFDTEEVLMALRKVDFPAAEGESRITIPLAFML